MYWKYRFSLGNVVLNFLYYEIIDDNYTFKLFDISFTVVGYQRKDMLFGDFLVLL